MLTLKTLRAVPLFAPLTDDLLQWILEHSHEVSLLDGAILFAEGEPADHFFVVLSGSLQITKHIGGHEIVLARHQVGTFTGEVPLLTGTPHIATARAVGASRLLGITAEEFEQMLSRCASIMRALLITISERIQTTEMLVQQSERLSSLGKLSAGLAHELNNPAAASKRAVEQLREMLPFLLTTTRRLTQHLPTEYWDKLDGLLQHVQFPLTLDTLAQSEREEDFVEWLEDHGLAEEWKLAATFVEAGLEPALFDSLAELLEPALFKEVLVWLEARIAAHELLAQVEQSTTRIFELVKAVKEYSYMDRAQLQEVDIHKGLENTLAILGHRLKGQIEVIREYDCNLPRLNVNGSELNQVWTNVLDNAIDAMQGHGQIKIRTWQEGAFAYVEFIDNGPGIPANIQPHIFEPFFTTKEVGRGTGLGLDIAYRIVVKNHHGDITVRSRPGETHFCISLPLNVSPEGSAKNKENIKHL